MAHSQSLTVLVDFIREHGPMSVAKCIEDGVLIGDRGEERQCEYLHHILCHNLPLAAYFGGNGGIGRGITMAVFRSLQRPTKFPKLTAASAPRRKRDQGL